MDFLGTRRRRAILWSLEIFILQKTKPAPPSCLVVSDLEEVCESRGGRGRRLGSRSWCHGLRALPQGVGPSDSPFSTSTQFLA